MRNEHMEACPIAYFFCLQSARSLHHSSHFIWKNRATPHPFS